MKVAGIIAEFDPFHEGHRRLIDGIRAQFGANTPIVVAMSASFTQRGGAAVCTGAARAEMALRGGANLILELPVGFSTASAETFARGGVGILAATGLVDVLCFGSESGDLPTLKRMAQALSSPMFSANLRAHCATGVSFAAARQKALEEIMQTAILTGPNDLLATEYLRCLPPTMDTFAVLRVGSEHGGVNSSSAVRRLLQENNWDAATELLPASSAKILLREREQGLCPADLRYAQRAVLYRLRTMCAQELADIADCGEGLENRLLSAACQAKTLDELYALTKSKRYAHARIRRIVLRAFLGMTVPTQQVNYIGVLGADQTGLQLLRKMKETATVPVITKPTHGTRLKGKAREAYLFALRADELWQLCLSTPGSTGDCWRDTPVIID